MKRTVAFQRGLVDNAHLCYLCTICVYGELFLAGISEAYSSQWPRQFEARGSRSLPILHGVDADEFTEKTPAAAVCLRQKERGQERGGERKQGQGGAV